MLSIPSRYSNIRLQDAQGLYSAFKHAVQDENGKSVAERHLDSILCSTSSVELEVCLLESPPPASLQWSGLIYQVRDEATGEPKVVLKGCGGKANCGETVALMGPSGAGLCLRITLQRAEKQETASSIVISMSART